MVVVCDNVIRRCLSGLGNTVVMVFAAPFGITIRGILMHAGVSRFSACVNSEWLQAVRAVICELRRGFLGSDFYVDCLLPDALDEDKVQQRLQSVLNIRFGNESIPHATVWWYITQLYLHHGLARELMYLQYFVHLCQVFSVYVGYDFEATVNVVPNLTGWSWSKRKRHIPMRVALRGERFPESDDTWVAAWVGSLLWAIHFKDGYCQGKLLFGADWQGARGCIGGELCIVFLRYSC